MSIPSTSTIPEGMGKKVAEREDAKLLNAIAQHGDPDAFTLLFKRYQKPAYSLAYHITRRPDLAEEAVQEAMLRIWKGAANFRGDGSARSWLLRIVANQSCDLIRKKSRRKDHAEEPAVLEESAVQSEREDHMVSNELVVALRKEIGNLGERDRCVIGLYYAGGMSQDEIADSLSMPARTVSYRIKKILECLHSRLDKAGFATGIVQTIPDSISNALCSGPTLPTGFSARILEGTFNAKAQASSLAQVEPQKVTSLAWLPAAAIVVFTAAVVGFLFAPETKTNPSKKAFVNDAQADIQSPTESTPDLLNKTWAFVKGPNPDINLAWGNWKWATRKHLRVGYMESKPNEKGALFCLPVEIPPGPCIIRFAGGIVNVRKRSKFKVMVGTKDMLLAAKVWGQAMMLDKRPDQSVLLFGNRAISMTNDKMHDVKEYDRPVAGMKAYIYFRNFRIVFVSIKACSEKDIPVIFKDYEAVKRGIEKKVEGRPDGNYPEFIEAFPAESLATIGGPL